MNKAYLLLGSNLGNREAFLNSAIRLLVQSQMQMLHKSSLYETSAWGIADQPSFYNLVIQVETELEALELLTICKEIEQQIGRRNRNRWMEREIDIDILFFNEEIVQLPELTIPHPQLIKRRFTLLPLAEIAPNLIHPELNLKIEDLLLLCIDKGMVEKLNP